MEADLTRKYKDAFYEWYMNDKPETGPLAEDRNALRNELSMSGYFEREIRQMEVKVKYYEIYGDHI